MNLHEYQAKALLNSFDIPVLRGYPAFSPKEAHQVASELEGTLWVVKSQIHAGGRGKGRFKESAAGDGGGVRLARSLEDVQKAALAMLDHTLVTVQTGPEGRLVRCVYIEEGASTIKQELYLSLLVDRSTSRISVIASTEGGMDIEAVAHDTPEKVHSLSFDPATGAMPHHGRRLAAYLGLKGPQVATFEKLLLNLYKVFVEKDLSLIEINPLGLMEDGRLICLDAKMSLDGNALMRHPELALLRDENEEDILEREAAKHDLSYVALDGNIGCMVNGAGLAMATMDIIKFYGAEPANFLDVGGSATKEKVAAAFKIMTSNPKVRGILINIFGGIMRCDVIAEGVIAAVKEVGLNLPLVVRLEGTHKVQGQDLLKNSGLKIIPASDLDEAARKIVEAVSA
jgi:succinyl-CoA synthetase beta subunit